MYQTLTNIFLFGIIWGTIAWLWMPYANPQSKRPQFQIRLCVHALWTSFLIMIIAAMILGLADIFNRRTWLLLVLAVSLPRLLFHRKKTFCFRLESLVVLCIPVLLLFTAWLAPDPGHWIAGGWDPGVYMNQGAAMARTGSLHPDDAWFNELIPAEDQPYFMRIFSTRRERFPGVVHENGRISYQFSRFFPSAIGLFASWGWVELASRLNYVIAILCLLTAFGWGLSLSGAAAFLFPALLLTQPIFTYHTNLPITEMLELGIILWAGLMLFQNKMQKGDDTRIAFAILCGILNRFSMIPFAAIFLLIGASALLAVEMPMRTRFKWALLYFLTTTIGLAISFQFAPVSIRGWQVTPLLLKVFTVGSLIGIAVLLVPISKIQRQTLRNLLYRISPIGLPIFLLLSLAFAAWYGTRPGQPPYFQRLIPFLGIGWAGLFVLAALFVGNLPKRSIGALVAFLCLFVVTIMMLIDPQITFWYPWVLRRYLAFTVPLLPLTILLAYERIAQRLPASWSWKRQLVPLPLLFGAFLLSGNTFLEGARLREYRGLEPILRNISQQIPQNAVIVSDDPRWGTPLQLVFGHKVLFGRMLWGNKDPDVFAHISSMLANLPDDYPVVFLTSTDGGMEIYPLGDTAHRFETIHVFPPTDLLSMVQHPRAATFVLRPLPRQFKLHELKRD